MSEMGTTAEIARDVSPATSSVDDTDITTVETAVDGILNRVQNDLGFPFSVNQTSQKPSDVLDYHFHAGIEVYLTTQWKLFEGFTLTEITLKAAADKFKNSPGALSVELSANAKIGDIDVQVTGRIPRLIADQDISFVLIVDVRGSLDALDPIDVVKALTNGGYEFSKVTDKLDDDLGGQIEDKNTSTGTSFSTGVLLIVTKPAKGSTFLKRLEIGFASDINWTIIKDHIELSQVALDLILDHPTASSSWDAIMDIDAVILVNQTELDVVGQISLGGVPSVSLAVKAGPSSGNTPEDVLDQVIKKGTNSTIDSVFVLPPNAQLSVEDEDPFEASLVLKKDKAGWYIQYVDAKLFWQTEYWFPFESFDLCLQELYFQYLASRDLPDGQSKQPSEMQLKFSAAFGGTLLLCNLPIAAVVTYQSAVGSPPASMTVITCTVKDTQNISLQQIAADSILNISSSKPRDLNAEVAGVSVPDSVPVDLGWCTSVAGSSGAKCILTFAGSELTQLQLWANFKLDWQVTSNLIITSMGIYFDITNPTSSNKLSIVKGYGYGSVSVSNNLNLSAFVAGISQPTGQREFLLGLSLSYNPTASLGTSPETVFRSSKFLGASPPTDDKWVLPSSAPSSASVKNTITSIDASMLVCINQSKEKQDHNKYITSLVYMQASLNVNGSWTVFDDVSLTQVSLNVIVKPVDQGNNGQISYFAQLSGVFSTDLSTVNNTKYNVILAAMIQYDAMQQKKIFTASISAHYVGEPNSDVPISTFLSMPLIKADPKAVQTDPSAAAIPSELSLSPSTLLGKPVAQCTLKVEQVGSIWKLKELEAKMMQPQPWVIISEKLRVQKSTLYLRITDPRSDTRKIQFIASTTIVIGSKTFLNASITALKGGNGKSDSVTIVFKASNFQEAIKPLVGGPLTMPADCPFASNMYSASMTIICKKDGSDSWSLSSIAVVIEADNDTTWTLGPVTVFNLSLRATFGFKPTSSTLSFGGSAAISGKRVVVEITLKDASTLDFAIKTPLQPAQLVDQAAKGGLKDAPDVTANSGLSKYTTTDCASADITFKRDSSWYVDSLYLRIESSKKHWALIKQVLWAEDLYLMITLKNIHTQKQLAVVMGITIGFEAPTGYVGNKTVKCDLTVTTKFLKGSLNLSSCTVSSFLYIATAGYWDPPEILNIKILKSLTLDVDWDDRTVSFIVTCVDWSLTDTLPKLAKMENPRLIASMNKTGGGFKATGHLAGKAHLLGVPLDLTYDLANGPFKIEGIDVKKAYELAQKLYKILKNLKKVAEVCEEIASVMSDLAALTEGIVDLVGSIFAALLALGVPKDVLSVSLDKVFGKHGELESNNDEHDDPSSNGNQGTRKRAPYMVVGGSLLSPGPANQDCSLVVYPKDNDGNSLQPFVSTKLVLSNFVGEGPSWQDIALTWSTVQNGFSCSLKRPPTAIPMKVIYTGLNPNLEYGFQNVIQDQASMFSLAKSTIDCPQTVGVKNQDLITLTPKDQNGKPRFGPGAAPELSITFVNQQSGTQPSYNVAKGFVVRNDSLRLPFTLLALGNYTLTIKDPSDQNGTPRVFVISAVNSVTPSKCVPYGEGLNSGVANTLVKLFIKLKDQDGNPYIMHQNETLDLMITMSVDRLSADPVTIPYSIIHDIITGTYTRPPQGTYQISITINNILLGDGPFMLTTATTAITSSVAKSTFTVSGVARPKDIIAAGDLITGLITTRDSSGSRWYQPLAGDSYKVEWSKGFNADPIKDNGDGTYSFGAVASTTYPNPNATVSIGSAEDPSQQCSGSPMLLKISRPRQISIIDAYGSGLEQGHDKTGTVQIIGRDEYSSVITPVMDKNYRVQLVRAGVAYQYQKTSDSSFTYRMPAPSLDSIMLLLSPSPVSGLLFQTQLYLVSSGEPSATDPTKCFIEWEQLLPNDTSRATLHAVDHNGQRRRQGGDQVQTLSLPSHPLIITKSIVDNLDGSYSIDLILPAAAFTAADPAPQLQISVNQTAIQDKPCTFPLSPNPFVKAIADGPGLKNATVGKDATFSIFSTDTDGHLTDGGFHDASAVLVQTGTETPKYVIAKVESIKNGVIRVVYKVNEDTGAGTYQCYIFVNSRQIKGSPKDINVEAKSIDDLDQAYLITKYTLGAHTEPWTVHTGAVNFWEFDHSHRNHTILKAFTGGFRSVNPEFKTGLSFVLDLRTTEDWFKNGGFMFSFDMTLDSRTPVRFEPFYQPSDPVTMVWKPGPTIDGGKIDNEQATTEWLANGQSLTVQNPQLTVVKPSMPSTLSFLYLLDNDLAKYRIYVFQAAQLITEGSWARTGPESIPKLGLRIFLTQPAPCTIDVSNVVTIPTRFRTTPGAPESSSDIIWSEAWSRKYVMMAKQGHDLNSSGLVISGNTGSDPKQTVNPIIRQIPPASTYGQSVAVYSVIASKTYYFEQQRDPNVRPVLAAILFGNAFWRPHGEDWINWDSRAATEVANSNMVLSATQPNTVMVIMGHDSATVISNGAFAFSQTKAGFEITATLESWWTDVTWRAIRAQPSLQQVFPDLKRVDIGQ